jgi:NADH:ubiquinone oxidoreductase subunit 2 (subunit N)
MQEIVRPAYKKYSGPQYLWDLKGLKESSPRMAFRWRVLLVSLAGIPPVYAFVGKAAIIWQSVQRRNYSLVVLA